MNTFLYWLSKIINKRRDTQCSRQTNQLEYMYTYVFYLFIYYGKNILQYMYRNTYMYICTYITLYYFVKS